MSLFPVAKAPILLVIYLHFFFENYGLGEKHVILNANNCSGQNKYKRPFRSTKVSCFSDIALCISKSSVSNINIPQLVHCNVFVPCYDRSSFLKLYFKKMQSNKLYHHFYVSSDQPGVMFVREFSSSYPKPVQLCINSPPKSLPPIIPPSRIKC